MNTKRLLPLWLTLVLTGITSLSFATTVTVNGSGSNFVINKVGGFDGVDGASREAAFVAAAQVWADILVSPVDIVIDAEFSSSLFCVANSATLGSAGPLSTYFSSGAETFGLQNNVWYPTALINAKNGSDYFVGSADINATFNADIGDADCLSSSGWYYGLDGNVPAGEIDFYEVVLHELGHGLGILSLVNSDGSNNSGVIDIFTTFLKDQSTATNWSAMNASQRSVAVVNTGNQVWTGAEVTALAGDLSAGVNGGYVQMYAPNPYESGSSISHFDTALTPNELMEPQYTGGATYDHSTALLKDIGWGLYVASNVVPSITSQSALDTDEETALTITLSDLTVSDSDNSYPADFSLTVNSGSNYSVSGNTITPAVDFTGTLTVPVSVNDGTDDSSDFNLSVTVNNLNDKPTITGQSSLSVNEDNSLTLSVSDLTIADPDDSTFTLTVGSGDDYSVSGLVITPDTNFNGTLTVPVTVNDGDIDSDSFNVSVTVNAQNDAPVITATPSVAFDEDTSHTFSLGDFSVSDVDSGSFALDVLAGTNYSESNNEITPAANFAGTLSVNARVFDGIAYSSTVSFNVSVNEVNDVPVITGQSTLSVNEDATLALSLSDITVTDPDDASFTLSVQGGSNYSVSGTSITPDASFNGILTVPVTVNDGDSDSDTFNVSVTVNAQNDAPVITATPSVAFDEDTSHTFSLGDFSVTDVDSASFTLDVLAGTNYSESNNEITPAANFAGTLSVNARVFDGIAYSSTVSFNVSVNEVNDVPVITGQSTLSINEDATLALSLSDITVTDPDDASFTLSVQSGSNYSVSGTNITPHADYNGALSVPVTVNDGEDDSIAFNLAVTVNAENDAPVITSLPVASLNEDESLSFSVSDFTVSDVDSSVFTLTLLSGSQYSLVGNTVYPVANFNGTLVVSAYVSDGSSNSATESFNVDVVAVNDAPVISGTPSTTVTIGDQYAASFSHTDIDSGSLTYSVNGNHDWLTINNSGELSGTPLGADIGTETVSVTVTDGALTDAMTFDLTVADANSADMSVTLSVQETLVSTNESTAITAVVANAGPATFADGYVLFDVQNNTQVTGLPVDCLLNSATQVRCDFVDVSSTQSFQFNIANTASSINVLIAEVFALVADPVAANNSDQTTWFVDSQQTEPVSTGQLAASVNTLGAAFADLDGDEKAELTLANDGLADEQSFQFDNAYTIVSADQNFATNAVANEVAIADFNNDGHPDVVFANTGVNTLYINNGVGEFGNATVIGNSTSHDLTVGDFNQDSFMDVLFANDGANHLYLNNQAGGFVLSQSIGSADSRGIASIDYNKDGWLDVVVVNADDDDWVYLNNSTDQSAGVFNLSPVMVGSTTIESYDVAVADVDGDGELNDVVISSVADINGHSLHWYSVNANVLSLEQQWVAGDALSVALGDFDGNGEQDIATVNAQHIVQLRLQNTAQFSLDYVFESQGAQAVVLQEMNGDVEADLVLLHDDRSPSKLYISDHPFVVAPEPEPEPEPETPTEPVTTTPPEVNEEPVDTAEPETPTVVVVQTGSLSFILLLLGVLLVGARGQTHKH